MKVDTIVTLDNEEKYYLVDETIQDNKKYFLATKVDENEIPINETEIFEESIDDNNEVFLEPVEDKEIYNYLSAIFVEKFNKYLEEANI